MTTDADNLTGPLASFVSAFTALVLDHPGEEAIVREGTPLLTRLIASDDWLPPHCTEAAADGFATHLLYCHPEQRFSVVCMVWGPGQTTPIHNHTVWGLIGVLRGVEVSQRFGFNSQGRLEPQGAPVSLQAGEVDAVSPRLGDIHQVRSGDAEANTISIHVYGADIGRLVRQAYRDDGSSAPFVSSYSSGSLESKTPQ